MSDRAVQLTIMVALVAILLVAILALAHTHLINSAEAIIVLTGLVSSVTAGIITLARRPKDPPGPELPHIVVP